MAYIIFGDSFTFPEGEAATNRVHTYAKGFLENGINVHVICFASEYDTIGDGLINGVFFYHPFGQRQRSQYFIIRRWQKFIKYFKTITLLRQISKNDKIFGINCWTQLLMTQLFVYVLAKYIKTKVILERSEHPLRNYQGSFFRKTQGNVITYIETKLCDGIFCISRNILDFYKSKGMSLRKLFLVPSTVDPERFIQSGGKPLPFPYIGYFGSLTFDRDNIDVLIRAFSMINDKHNGIHLVMGGFCTEKEKRQIKNLVTELKISLKVDLLKYLTRQEIIRYMMYADILVMVRSSDFQSQASFPSKLTEYLATSKPVVTVNVGEITDYLSDGVDSFIVEPENSEKLAEKLDYVLTHYELALRVGQRGKELTNTVFNYKSQAKRMLDFISSS